MIPDTAYVVSQGPDPHCLGCNADGVLSKVSLSRMGVMEEVPYVGFVPDVAVSIPQGYLYALRSFNELVCSPGPPPCRHMEVIRKNLVDQLDPMGEAQDITLPPEVSNTGEPRVLILTPTLQDPSGPAKAYVSASGLPQPACSLLATVGTLFVVEDLSMVPNSPVVVLTHTTPFYEEMAPSPIPADPRIFAIHPCGVDVIDRAADTIQELALSGLAGDRIKAARLPGGGYRLFGLDKTNSMLVAYDLDASHVAGTASFTDPRGLAVTPDGGTIVLLTGEGGGLLRLLEADTLLTRQAIPFGVPGPNDTESVAVSADGTTALVADDSRQKLLVLRIAAPRLSQDAANLAAIVGSLPDVAFDPPSQAGDLRAALLAKIADVEATVAQAEATQDPVERARLLASATRTLENNILKRMDGTFGGNPGNDWITDPDRQGVLFPITKGLVDDLDQAQIVGSTSTCP